MSLLSESQYKYKMEIESIFDSLDWDYLNENERNMFSQLHDTYESGIMYNDYSHMEEHHQNKLDYLLAHEGSSREICRHRSSLILAKLAKMMIKLPNGKNSYMNIPKQDVEIILSLLEKSFDQTIDTTNFKDRRDRCNDYKRWMTLAKYSNQPVDKGILFAKNWISLVEKGAERDPLPYYYLSALYYLSVLEGNVENVTQAQDASRLACNYASNKAMSINRIRDVLKEGKGIGQLCDISVFNDIGTLEVYENITPVTFSGRFDGVESARGTVSLRTPVQWRNCKAKFTVRENNNLTEDFITHTISFYGGFSFEGIVAINSSVRDNTAKEVLPSIKKISYIIDKPEEINKKNKAGRVSLDSIPETITDFKPNRIKDLATGDFIIQGTVFGDKEGGLHSKSLPKHKEMFYDEREFAEFIISLEKIKVLCKGIDEKGRYRIRLVDDSISVDEMKSYGAVKTREQDKDKLIKSESAEQSVVKQEMESLPDIQDPVFLLNIKKGNNCVLGKIQYNGKEYEGKITSNVSPKKFREWEKKKRILVKIISSNSKGYVVKPV